MSPPPAPQPLSSVVRVPLEMLDGRPTISISLNGRGPFRFIVDSGATATLVDPRLTAELGLAPVARALAGDPSGGPPREVEVFEAAELVIADGRFHDVRLIGLDDGAVWERLGGVRGVLSTRFMAGNVVILDFVAGELGIAPGSLAEGDGSVAYADPQRPIPNLRIDVVGHSVDADIDSGNKASLSLPAALRDSLSFTGELTTDSVRLVTRTMQVQRGRLDGSVRIAGLVFDRPQIDLQDGFPFANVGSQFLGGLVLAIDPANARLRLSREAAAEPPPSQESPTDSSAVIAAALDYIEGWSDGDAERMRRALHPDLVKEIAEKGGQIQEMGADELVRMTGMKGADGEAPADFRDRTHLLTVFGGVAAVRIDAPQWVDLLHLVRTDDGWKILHVLWELR
jgi:hypothetical protein